MTELLSSIAWIWGVTAGTFVFLNTVASVASKKAAYEFIISKSIDVPRLPQIALEIFERIFGRKHLSFRCLFTSIIASLVAISLWYIFHAIISVYAQKGTPGFENEYSNLIWDELSYPFLKETSSSFGVSVAVNLFLDYFALLKTRLLIKLLEKTRPSILLGTIFVAFDFVFSFALFQCFYLFLYLVSVTAIFGGGKFFLPAADPYGFYMTIEVFILSTFLLSPTAQKGAFSKFLANSHVVSLTLIVTLVPITITSVFFYASLMPSIWLWLFLLAASLSRVLAPIYPWAIRALDFEHNAIRTLGYLLSILLSLLWLGFIGAVKLYFFALLHLAT